MTWNYRVMLRPEEVDPAYGIYEVFYEGTPPRAWACTEEPFIVGDTVEELLEVLVRMAACTQKPVLEYKDF